MGKRHEAGGDGLAVAEAVLDLLLVHALGYESDELGRACRRKRRHDHRHDGGDQDLGEHADEVDALDARADDDGADQAAEQGMGGAGGQADQPGEKVPQDGAHKTREYEFRADRHLLLVDEPARDGLGDLGGEERADEVQRARRDDRGPGLQSAGGDGCGHRVRRVMKAVGEVENQGGDDDHHHDDEGCDFHALPETSVLICITIAHPRPACLTAWQIRAVKSGLCKGSTRRAARM